MTNRRRALFTALAGVAVGSTLTFAQLEGRKVQVSMHLDRRPVEPVDRELATFYDALLRCLRRPEARDGDWQLWNCRPAWEGNPSHQQFIVTSWQLGEQRLLAVVNYGSTQAQCYVTLGLPGLAGNSFTLVDLLSGIEYERKGDELGGKGLYLDMPPWGHHIFELRR